MLSALLVLGSAVVSHQETAPVDLVQQMGMSRELNNGYVDYLRAASGLTGSENRRILRTYFGSEMAQDMNREQVRGIVAARFSKLWDGVRAGNRKVSYASYMDRADFNTGLEDLAEMKQLGRLGVVLAEARFAEGDAAGGWRILSEQLVFSEQLKRSGSLLHFLVGNSIESMAQAGVVFSDPLMPVGVAREIEQKCLWVLAGRAFLDSMGREEKFLANGMTKMTREELVLFFGDLESDEDALDVESILNSIPWAVRELRRGANVFSEIGVLPEADWKAAVEERSEQMRAIRANEVFYPMSDMSLELGNYGRMETRLLLAQALVSEFYWREGRFPTSLKEAGFKEVEPVYGKEFGYRLTGKRFEIWSEWGGKQVRYGETTSGTGSPQKGRVKPVREAGLGARLLSQAF